MNRFFILATMTPLLLNPPTPTELNPLPTDTSPAAMVQLWQQRTVGTNVALGCPVAFDNPPNYHLTMVGGNDPHDLTDGKLASRSGTDQRIWFDRDAVGWTADYPDSRFVLDLGQVRPLDRLVWRISGGNPARDFRFPAQIRVYASPDGVDVREVATLRFDPAGGEGTYYLPDSDEVYIYPLTIPLHGVRARYLCVRFQLQSAWFVSDEIAVFQAADTTAQEPCWDSLPPADLPMTGVSILPDRREMTILPGVHVPIYFDQYDLRTDRTRPVTYRLQAPEGLRVTPVHFGMRLQQESAQVWTGSGPGGYQRLGPVYLATDGSQPVSLTVSAMDAGGQGQSSCTLKLRPLHVPSFPPFQRLHFSIGWMTDHVWHAWPELEKSWRRLGFNGVPTMPRGWTNAELLHRLGSAREIPAATAATPFVAKLQEMRQRGFQVVYVESPLHVMTWLHPNENEYRCQSPSAIPPKESVCVSYRGRYYQEEIRRVADSFQIVGGADYVFLDIELLEHALQYSPICDRCRQAKADLESKMGQPLTTEAFVSHQCEQMLKDIVTAIQQTAADHGWKPPQIGLYNTAPPQIAMHTFHFDRLYPDVLQYAMPSFYVQGNHQHIHDVTRRVRATLRANDIIPWLTAGTAGRYEPYKLRLSVWEALLNGSRGVTFFCDRDFYPSMLTEFTRALQPLRPYETLLCDGAPAQPPRNPAGWRLSMMRRRQQTLLLAVNTSDKPADSRSLRSLMRGGRWTLLSNPAAPSASEKTRVPAGEGCLWLHAD